MSMQQQQQQQMQQVQVVLKPSDFAEDADVHLGRANGNIYLRKPEVPGVHDGQIMVRLKKKRFIIIDYGIVPNDADVHAAAQSPHIDIPTGAGKAKCNTADCPKVGVPVLLYDSEPNEPASLYVRSGLCFTCQRNLNEKRRTERKRTSKSGDFLGGDNNEPSLIYALGPSQKKFKLNGNTIQLQSDAIIVNGGLPGMKHYGEGYGFQEIGDDLRMAARQAIAETDRLLDAVSSNASSSVVVPTTNSNAAAVLDGPTQQQQQLAPKSLLAQPNSNEIPNHTETTTLQVTQQEPSFTTATTTPSATRERNANDETITSQAHAMSELSTAVTNQDIPALYDKAFLALNKAIFLLSQWKASWDAAIAAAHETVADPSLADALASAAAVVAAASSDQTTSTVAAAAAATVEGAAPETSFTSQVSSNGNNHNHMVSLLLAADGKSVHDAVVGQQEQQQNQPMDLHQMPCPPNPYPLDLNRLPAAHASDMILAEHIPYSSLAMDPNQQQQQHVALNQSVAAAHLQQQQEQHLMHVQQEPWPLQQTLPQSTLLPPPLESQPDEVLHHQEQHEMPELPEQPVEQHSGVPQPEIIAPPDSTHNQQLSHETGDLEVKIGQAVPTSHDLDVGQRSVESAANQEVLAPHDGAADSLPLTQFQGGEQDCTATMDLSAQDRESMAQLMSSPDRPSEQQVPVAESNDKEFYPLVDSAGQNCSVVQKSLQDTEQALI